MYTTDEDNNLVTKNLLGMGDNAIATRRYSGDYADKNYFYLKDIRGSVTSVVDDAMAGVTSYEYDDFGITTVNGDQDFENQICYTGGIYDELTGLYYLNARYYDPEVGRFLTEDTYRGETDDFDTWHLYAYCANNPVNYTDPSGHKKVIITANNMRYSFDVTTTIRRLEIGQVNSYDYYKRYMIQECYLPNKITLLSKTVCKKLASKIISKWNDKKMKQKGGKYKRLRGNSSKKFGEMSQNRIAVEIFAHAALYYEYDFLKKIPELRNKIAISGKTVDVNRYDRRYPAYLLIWQLSGKKVQKYWMRKHGNIVR